MPKIRINAEDGGLAQFLETEASKLEAFYKSLEQLEPFIQEFGTANDKEAQMENLFPDKPYKKPSEMTDEEFWKLQDDWAESPRGELWSEMYNKLYWGFPILDNISSTQESVADLLKKIKQIKLLGE